jgi:hypothetical protein
MSPQRLKVPSGPALILYRIYWGKIPFQVSGLSSMPRTYHIWTIGCQMNEADSRRLAQQLEFVG